MGVSEFWFTDPLSKLDFHVEPRNSFHPLPPTRPVNCSSPVLAPNAPIHVMIMMIEANREHHSYGIGRKLMVSHCLPFRMKMAVTGPVLLGKLCVSRWTNTAGVP